MGDLVVSLPVQARILSRAPEAEVHWLVRPYAAPVLAGLPGVAGVHSRIEGQDLAALFRDLRPDAVLTLSHRDGEITVAARRAGVPIRVARARGLAQILAASHLLWKGRRRSGRHEAQNALDFLHPFGWSGGCPSPVRLRATSTEAAAAEGVLAHIPRPRLGLVLKGSGAGAYPSRSWWEGAMGILREDGWNPIVLAPAEESPLPRGDLRSLMARLEACDAVLSPSTGPAHLAAALGVPTLCMMGLRINHCPWRWAPLGQHVQTIQYPGREADLAGGMDRLDPAALLPHLRRLRHLGGPRLDP